jgi:hypothetical protein
MMARKSAMERRIFCLLVAALPFSTVMATGTWKGAAWSADLAVNPKTGGPSASTSPSPGRAAPSRMAKKCPSSRSPRCLTSRQPGAAAVPDVPALARRTRRRMAPTGPKAKGSEGFLSAWPKPVAQSHSRLRCLARPFGEAIDVNARSILRSTESRLLVRILTSPDFSAAFLRQFDSLEGML